MKSFVSRRLRNLALLALALAPITWFLLESAARLGRPDFISGYLLLVSIVFLALYNLRKKAPIAVAFSSASWLQLHTYVGLGTAVLFGLHVDWRLPDGILESLLATLYWLTFLSGVVGLIWTRTVPKQLARVSEEFVYERIPALRQQIYERAQQVVLETVRATGNNTLGEFFSERLQGYLEKPRGLGYWLRPTSEVRKRLLAELTEVTRYLSEPERQAGEQIFSLVRRRDDLDYHAALQWRLKAWLFMHIGLTYPLVMVAVVHGLVVHLFDGGAL